MRQTFANASSRSLLPFSRLWGTQLQLAAEAFGLGGSNDGGAGNRDGMVGSPESGDKFDTLISDELRTDGGPCAYCTIIAARVSHTRCYTAFYLVLFVLGTVAAIVSMMTIVQDENPETRGVIFFVSYGGLLLLFAFDVIVRLLASGWKRFRRRHLNCLDLTVLVIALAAVGVDIYDTVHYQGAPRKPGVFSNL